MGTEAGVGADEVSGAGASVSVGTEEELGDEGMDVVDDGIASDAGISSTTGTEDTDSGTIGEAEVCSFCYLFSTKILLLILHFYKSLTEKNPNTSLFLSLIVSLRLIIPSSVNEHCESRD